jgi:hypothetical protein
MRSILLSVAAVDCYLDTSLSCSRLLLPADGFFIAHKGQALSQPSVAGVNPRWPTQNNSTARKLHYRTTPLA